MSRQLLRIKNLVADMNEIRTPAIRSVENLEPEFDVKPVFIRPEKISAPQVAPVVSTGKVSMVLNGDVVVALTLAETEEVIEVRRSGNSLCITFSDGKSVQLPLKGIA